MLNEAKIVPHVDSSLYEVVIFADRSAVHTRPEPSSSPTEQRLPFYVPEDIQLLQSKGFSAEEIKYFIQELNRNDNLLNEEKFEAILQRIIDLTDLPTRLKCREVCQKWCRLVDQSSSWKHVKLVNDQPHFHRALLYFQQIDIFLLDLSEASIDLSSFEHLPSDFCLYSLRSLRLSTDHPDEFFSRLFRIVPYVEHLQLVHTSVSNRIQFVIDQCQEHFKCLQRLQIQVRSASDQLIDVQSSSIGSIPISYEVIHG